MTSMFNFFRKPSAGKPLAASVLISLMLLILAPAAVPQAHAQLPNLPAAIGQAAGAAAGAAISKAISGVGELISTAIYGTIGRFVAKAVYVVSYIIVFSSSIALGVLSWGVAVMLNMNSNIVNSTTVQVGFSITSAIANFGFVIAITVIGVATILRREHYGMKQALSKLVAAAILINFSLVIAGPILGLATQLSNYFLGCSIATPGGGCAQSAGGYVGFNQFADILAGAFNPQRSLTVINADVNPAADYDWLEGALSGAAEAFGQSLAPISSLIFVAGMIVVFCITLFTLNIMLLIRYITLGILLILMPFAWLMWIFPNLKHHWTTWWSTFIRWTFFAPLVLFFLYLAIATSNALGDITTTEGSQFATFTTDGGSNSIFSAVVDFVTTALSPIIEQLLQGFLVVGLAVGGIFAANKLSIHGASAAMGAMKGAGKAFGQYVGKTTVRVGLRGAARVVRPSSPAGGGVPPRIPPRAVPPPAPPGGGGPPSGGPKPPPLWYAAGFNTPQESKQWHDAMMASGNSQAVASENARASMSRRWKDAGFTPDQARGYIRRGIVNPDAARAQATGVPSGPPPSAGGPAAPTPGAGPTPPPITLPPPPAAPPIIPPSSAPQPPGWRHNLADWLEKQAKHPALKTPPLHFNKQGWFGAKGLMTGVAGAVWGGIGKGSGLWGKKTVNNWECQVCGYILPSTKKPTQNCSNLACSNPSAPDWKQIT